MKDTREIVLVFKEKYGFSNVKIASLLSERFEDIGEPTILPEQPNLPKIIFNSNPEFLMNVNNEYVSFLVNKEHFDEITNIVFDLVDIFESEDVYFKKIGYIANTFLSPSNIEIIKNKYINIEMENDFNIAWYKELETKYDNLNCWERFIVDSNRFKELLIQFDINTKVESEIKFDMKFIKEFFNEANSHIEKNIEL